MKEGMTHRRRWGHKKRKPLSDALRQVLDHASPREQAEAKAFLLAHHQRVTAAAIAAEVAHGRRRKQLAVWQEAVMRNEDEVGARAARLVQQALDAFGTAPVWRELGKAMGWKVPAQREWAVPWLVERGWLTIGTEPRSLRPGPKYHHGLAAGSQPSQGPVGYLKPERSATT